MRYDTILAALLAVTIQVVLGEILWRRARARMQRAAYRDGDFMLVAAFSQGSRSFPVFFLHMTVLVFLPLYVTASALLPLFNFSGRVRLSAAAGAAGLAAVYTAVAWVATSSAA
jgi:hypothetical protein